MCYLGDDGWLRNSLIKNRKLVFFGEFRGKTEVVFWLNKLEQLAAITWLLAWFKMLVDVEVNIKNRA